MMTNSVVEEARSRKKYAAWLCHSWNKAHTDAERLIKVDMVFMLETTARTFALPPGRYHISAIVVPDFRRKPYEIHDAPPFELASGKLNYIGDFEVYPERDDLLCRLHNRSGRLVIHLREREPALIEGQTLSYVGGEDDGWVGTLGAGGR